MTTELPAAKTTWEQAPGDHPPPQPLPLLAVLQEEFAELHPATPGEAASEPPADLLKRAWRDFRSCRGAEPLPGAAKHKRR